MFDMKRQLMWSKLKVGLVISLALLILFATVFFAGNLEDLFFPKVELKAQIQDVRGLRKGAPVWLSGIEIGSVKDIDLHPAYGTIVTLSVNKSALAYLKKDTQASVLTLGLLGDKYMELSTGSPEAGLIEPKEMIKGAAQVELKDIMETSAMSIQRLTEFIKKLEHLVAKIEEGDGTIARLISDPTLYDNLKETTKDLSLTVKEIRDARGTIKLLVEDPGLYHRIVATLSSFEEFGKKINEGSGTMAKLLHDPALYDKMVAASSSIEEVGRNFAEGSGTLKRLTEDPSLYENLNKASLQLSSVLERIDRGEGLAGTLVRDKELADELKGLLAEIKELTRNIKEHPGRYFKFSIF